MPEPAPLRIIELLTLLAITLVAAAVLLPRLRHPTANNPASHAAQVAVPR